MRMVLKSIFTTKVFIFALLILTLGIIFREKFEWVTKTVIEFVNEELNTKISTSVSDKQLIKVFSENQLAKFNGVDKNQLFLGLMGSVYDVSEGRKYYQKGSDYNYFIGKDGSRAFVTGNFKDESKEKDHVLDLPCNSITSLLEWNRTYTTKYKYIGVLNGRYYDKYGIETPYMKELHAKIVSCEEKNQEQVKQDAKFPPCNVAWNEDEGYKVWCTKSSGGISRRWIGVPQQLFKPGHNNGQCVCMNPDEQYEPNIMFKSYEKCSPQKDTCYLGQNNPTSLDSNQ